MSEPGPQNDARGVAGGTALYQLYGLLRIAQTETQYQVAGLACGRLLRVRQEDVPHLAVAMTGGDHLEKGRSDGNDQVRRSDHDLIVLSALSFRPSVV